jgi:hypothetical protein
VLFAVAPNISFATATGGTNPHPQVVQQSSFSVAVSVILSILGL